MPAHPHFPQEFPPNARVQRSERRRLWRWLIGAGVVFGVLTVAGVVAVISLFLVGFIRYANHDRIEFIEEQRFLDAIAQPCAQLALIAEANPVRGSSENRADALETISFAGRSVPDSLNSFDAEELAADMPTLAWIDDWNILLDAVDVYVVQLRNGGNGDFELPMTEDGHSIISRMNLASTPDCEVPPVFANLDRSPPSDPNHKDG